MPSLAQLDQEPLPERASYPSLARLLVLLAFVVLFPACARQSDTIVSIALHPRNPNILYVATNESVYKTRDGGTSWERMTTDLSSCRMLTLAIDPRNPATVYAGTMMDAVYKSLSRKPSFYCGERSAPICVVLGPKKSSTYSSPVASRSATGPRYASGFFGPGYPPGGCCI